jgi:hypothetical protein
MTQTFDRGLRISWEVEGAAAASSSSVVGECFKILGMELMGSHWVPRSRKWQSDERADPWSSSIT